MLFIFIICHLIFCVHFSLEAKLDGGRNRHHSGEGEDDSKQEVKNFLNETNGSSNSIKKSQVEELIRLKNQYRVKNFIEEFEILYAFFFEPDWTEVDDSDWTIHRIVQIRRQKWNYILEDARNTLFVKRLNSEMQKAGLNQTKFCEEIAEMYLLLMDNYFLFEKVPNPKEPRENSKTDRDPLQSKSISVFLNSISDLKLDIGGSKETVQVPKLLYKDLVQNDIHKLREIRKLKQNHEKRVQRLKDEYRRQVKKVKDGSGINSELEYE